VDHAFKLLIAVMCLVGCQSRQKNAETIGKPDSTSASDPKLTKPTVKRIWIPRKIDDDGRVMEDAHWRYEITGGSSWAN
jgi:uncharacterized lipoprotein YmbA